MGTSGSSGQFLGGAPRKRFRGAGWPWPFPPEPDAAAWTQAWKLGSSPPALEASRSDTAQHEHAFSSLYYRLLGAVDFMQSWRQPREMCGSVSHHWQFPCCGRGVVIDEET